MALELMSWLGMVGVVAAVWQLSAGRVTSGNWLMLAACLVWIVYGIYIEAWALATMNTILAARSVWQIGRS